MNTLQAEQQHIQAAERQRLIETDIAIRQQQADARRLADDALKAAGRLWENGRDWYSRRGSIESEVYVVVDLTNDDLASRAFVTTIFPYERGDACLMCDLTQAQAILRLARPMATEDQLRHLMNTPTIVGYALKTKEEVVHLLPE